MAFRGLKDQVALVTGGGSGIGRAISLRLAEEGCRLAVFDLNAAGAEESVRLAGGTAAAFAVDITDHAAVTAAVARRKRSRRYRHPGQQRRLGPDDEFRRHRPDVLAQGQSTSIWSATSACIMRCCRAWSRAVRAASSTSPPTRAASARAERRSGDSIGAAKEFRISPRCHRLMAAPGRRAGELRCGPPPA